MLIGITGASESGKSSFAKNLQALNSEYKIYSFSEQLKIEVSEKFSHMGKSCFGWNGDDWTGSKTPLGRQILKDYAQDMRNKDPEHWVDIVKEKIAIDKPFHTVIDDMRYIGELDWAGKDGIVVYMKRPSKEEEFMRQYQVSHDMHPSEGEWRVWLLRHMYSDTAQDIHIVHNEGSLEDLKIMSNNLDFHIQKQLYQGKK